MTSAAAAGRRGVPQEQGGEHAGKGAHYTRVDEGACGAGRGEG